MTSEISSVAVLGAGAMGAMYAAYFHDARLSTCLVASGARADRLRDPGLTVNGRRLDVPVVTPSASHSPVDLVLVAVKSHHLDEALHDLAPLVGEHTVIMSALNGLTSEDTIAARFPQAHVLLCIALAMDARREGTDVRWTQAGRLDLGDPDNTDPDPDVLRVQRALDRAGLAWTTPVDMRRAMWWKFMVNVGANQATALTRSGYGALREPGGTRDLMLALIHEVLAVATAEGVALDADDVERWEHVLAGQPTDGWTSMRQDVEAGRITEVDLFGGTVVDLGRRHGIPTPYNQAAVWALHGLTTSAAGR